MKLKSQKVKFGLFFFYLVSLIVFILFKYFSIMVVDSQVRLVFRPNKFSLYNNFIPFRSILLILWGDVSLSYKMSNLLGNIVGFIPFGFLLPQIWRKMDYFLLITTLSCFFSTLLEAAQLAFGLGSFDVDDILLNTFGGMLGYLFFKITFFYIRLERKW